MALSLKQLQDLYQVAQTAALTAGKYIAENKNKPQDIKHKEVGSSLAAQVVTQIDLDAQRLILEVLEPSIKSCDLGLLTEESEDNKSRLAKEYFWCIDPLDGTLAFAQNQAGFATSIALVHQSGEALLGAVYDPTNHNLYHAFKGHGAYKNNEKLKVKDLGDTLTLYFDLSYRKSSEFEDQVQKIKAKLSDFGFKKLGVAPIAGAVINAIGTIESAAAIYYKRPKEKPGGGSLWDFAATSIIQQEAGAFVSDYFQRPLNLNPLQTTFMNKNGIIYTSHKELYDILED